MIEINGKVYRNLQEQVYENVKDIEELRDLMGYHGPYDSIEDIEGTPKDKMLFLIGTSIPYEVYQYDALTQHFEDLGPFAAEGPQGIPGERGPAGIPGVSAGFGTPEAHVTTLASDVDASVSIETSGPDTAKVFTFDFGIPQGIPGETGETGNGIASIAKTGTVGLVDTYTITMTDGSTYNFTVTNGKDGAATIEAGTGININGDTISVDQTVVALKSELSQYLKDNDLNYSGTFRGKAVYVKAEGTYTSTSYGDGVIGRTLPYGQPGYTYTMPNKSGTFAMTDDVITSYNDLTDKPSIPTKTSDLTNDSGFITSAALTSYVTTTQLEDALDDYALKTDIPENVSELTNDAGYTTQTWVQNQGYITGITSSDVTTALGYVPGTSNFSGDYDDLTDKPDLSVYELKSEAFSGDYDDLTNKPTIPTATSQLTNDSGFITGVTWNDVTGKPTFATVATSGSYNDLSDKPTIPNSASAPFLGVGQASDGLVLFSLTGASGTYYKYVEAQSGIKVNLQALNPNFGSGLTSSYNSSTNALDVAVDTTTVALKSEIPAAVSGTNDGTNWTTLTIGNATYGIGGGSTPSNMVTTDTAQTITGFKTFEGGLILPGLGGAYTMQPTGVGIFRFNDTTQQHQIDFALPISKTGSSYTLATTDDIPTVPTTATSTSTSTSTSTVTPSTVTLTFTYSDNTTENVTLMTGASVATSTTTNTTTTLS